MGTRTSYPPGTFCWVDLSTSDRDGARSFYDGLLGWAFDERPGAGGSFSMATVGGDAVAGARRSGAAGGRAGNPLALEQLRQRRGRLGDRGAGRRARRRDAR